MLCISIFVLRFFRTVQRPAFEINFRRGHVVFVPFDVPVPILQWCRFRLKASPSFSPRKTGELLEKVAQEETPILECGSLGSLETSFWDWDLDFLETCFCQVYICVAWFDRGLKGMVGEFLGFLVIMIIYSYLINWNEKCLYIIIVMKQFDPTSFLKWIASSHIFHFSAYLDSGFLSHHKAFPAARKSVRIMDASELCGASLRPLGDGTKIQAVLGSNIISGEYSGIYVYRYYMFNICSCMFISIV